MLQRSPAQKPRNTRQPQRHASGKMRRRHDGGRQEIDLNLGHFTLLVDRKPNHLTLQLETSKKAGGIALA